MAFLSGHWQVLLLGALIATLWQTQAVWPLKLLIVFLHELSHALSVLATGGKVISLDVNALQGGEVISRGGNRFLTLTAGYLGSLLIGVTLFLFALRTRADRAMVAVLGIITLLAVALYVREPFAIGFGVVTAAVLLLSARALGHAPNDLILRIIGLASMIYVPWDIFEDTLKRPHLPSDAHMLAQEFGGTTMLWGGLWLALSLAVIAASLRFGLGADSNLRPQTDHST